MKKKESSIYKVLKKVDEDMQYLKLPSKFPQAYQKGVKEVERR
jgi:hypothetical protein